ncbi:MAG: hypothetical protein AAGP08_18775, partial [Pseudomonadota bacterium]
MSLRQVDRRQNIPVQQNLQVGQAPVDPRKADRLRSNALSALKPVFRRGGPAYKQPLAYRSDLGPARQKLGALRQLVRDRRDAAQQKLDNTWSWRSYAKSVRRADLSALTLLDSHLALVDAAARKLNHAQNAYTYLRNQPIPHNPVVRQQHFQKLRQAAQDFTNASQDFEDRFQILDQAVAAHVDRLGLFARSAKRAVRDGVAAFKAQLAASYKSVDAGAAFRATIAEDRSRIDKLERRLKRAANQGDLEAILGDPNVPDGPKLTTNLSLQALRSSEPIGPDLKYTLPDKARMTNLSVLGAGGCNTVYRASYRVPGANQPIDYALKPLDTRQRMAGSFPDLTGLSRSQTRTYSRHAAAHQLSKTLGYDLVDEPRLAQVDGQLHLALPIAKGFSPKEMRHQFSLQNTGPDGDLPKKIMRELHLKDLNVLEFVLQVLVQ